MCLCDCGMWVGLAIRLPRSRPAPLVKVMGNQGGKVLTTFFTMVDDVKLHESDAERHKLADVVHQLSKYLLANNCLFQVQLGNKTVVSCLFCRIVKTMALGTVDSSMHYYPWSYGLWQ